MRMLPTGVHEQFVPLDLVELTRWAIEGRYPDDFEPASSSDAEKALETARAVTELATARMSVVARPSGETTEEPT